MFLTPLTMSHSILGMVIEIAPNMKIMYDMKMTYQISFPQIPEARKARKRQREKKE